jgi:hypothetical protein
MKTPQNRMANPDTRTPAPVPTPHKPVERVLVQPPPESLIKCPHCGSAGKLSKNPNECGCIPVTKENRRLCLGCGARLAFSHDWKTVRIIG